jgi:heterodisulfide reductase subunit A2
VQEDLRGSLRERKAIDFTQKETVDRRSKVGTIIVATGFQAFDAKRIPQYGYGIYPNVYTALEVERLVNASGPTGGEVVLRDGREPKAVGIIHCVGSRDKKTNRWCSRVCCMYSMKLAHLVQGTYRRGDLQLLHRHPDAGQRVRGVLRQAARGGCAFHPRSGGGGDRLGVGPEEEGQVGDPVEDTLAGYVRRIPVDMVVLANGLEPQRTRRTCGACST